MALIFQPFNDVSLMAVQGIRLIDTCEVIEPRLASWTAFAEGTPSISSHDHGDVIDRHV